MSRTVTLTFINVPDAAMKGTAELEAEYNIRVPDQVVIDFNKIPDHLKRRAIDRFQHAMALGIAQLLPEDVVKKLSEGKACGPHCTCFNQDGTKREKFQVEVCSPDEIPDEVIEALQKFASDLPGLKQQQRQMKQN